MKEIKEFLKKWEETPEPRQCFIDQNGCIKVWSGDQNRFGDCPGRSFGFENVLAICKPAQTAEEAAEAFEKWCESFE